MPGWFLSGDEKSSDEGVFRKKILAAGDVFMENRGLVGFEVSIKSSQELNEASTGRNVVVRPIV